MNILYLSYWNFNDPLTHSTVFPNLRILSDFSWTNRIVFVNIERELKDSVRVPIDSDKITYCPFFSSKRKNVLVEKTMDFKKAPVFISRLIGQYEIDRVVARGAQAGGLAYLVWRKTRIPFYVESLEPHAQYMLDAGVWSRFDPRTIVEQYLEHHVKKQATGLMTVAKNYTLHLESLGIETEKLRTVPCTVDVDLFAYSGEMRMIIRNRFGINESDIVGIYAGRYGGIYLEKEAAQLYKLAFDFFSSFRLILLVPESFHKGLIKLLGDFQIPMDRVNLFEVKHHDVSAYLSAGDFAFATIKPGPSRKYCSSVKIGEYWANGLPIILTEGVGDEDQLIRKNPRAGVLFHPATMEKKSKEIFGTISELVAFGRESNQLAKLAHEHRNPQLAVDAYEYFLKPLL
jgi:hypothetical protein